MKTIFGTDANKSQQFEDIMPYKIKKDNDIFDNTNHLANINSIHDHLISQIVKPNKVPLNFLKKLKDQQKFYKDASMNSGDAMDAYPKTQKVENNTMVKDFQTDMVKDLINKKKTVHSEKKIMSKSQNFFNQIETKERLRESSA